MKCFDQYNNDREVNNTMKASFLTKETILDQGVKDRKFPKFNIGDTVKVALKVKEGNKERIQMFEGNVIAFHNNGVASSFTVRKISSNGIGVEKIFPYYSPIIKDIELIRRGIVRRAKLYYLRDRVGKATKIKEKVKIKQKKVNNVTVQEDEVEKA